MKLWKHQKAGIARATETTFLRWDEGTGKTPVYIEICKKFGCEEVLLIVPPPLVEQWTEFLESYDLGGMHVTLETYDRAARRVEQYRAQPFDAIVLDEASKIKRWQSKRTRLLCRLSEKLQPGLRILGSGTPLSNSQGMELYSYARFTFASSSPFKGSFSSFRAEYFEEEQPFQWEAKDSTPRKFERITRGWFDHVRKSECLSLPDKVYSTVRLRNLTGTSRKLYDAVRKYGVAKYGSKVAHATGKAAVIQKLQQLAQGEFYVREDRDEIGPIINRLGLDYSGRLDNPKGEWLIECLPNMLANGGVLIVSQFTGALEVSASLLGDGGYRVGRYYDKYRDSLKSNILVAQEMRIAFGHNLQHIRSVIFLGNSGSLERRRQTENRAHRAGQKAKVTIYDPIVPNTPDEPTLQALRDNSDYTKKIMRDFGKEF